MSKGASPYFSLCTLALHLVVVVVLLLSAGSFPLAQAQNHLAQDAMATNKPVPMIGKPAPDFKGALARECAGREARHTFFVCHACVHVWLRE